MSRLVRSTAEQSTAHIWGGAGRAVGRLLGMRRIRHALHRYLLWQHSWIASSVILVTVFTILFAGYNLLHTSAATTTLVPNGDITTAWAVTSGTTDSSCAGGIHCDFVDDGATPNDTDYVETGVNGVGGEVEEFALSSPSSVASASQVTVRVRLKSTIISTADTIGFALRINGTLQAVTTVTPTGSYADYTTTYNGSWTQADVDSMQVNLVRNVLGTGPSSSRDDEVYLSNVSAALTYVPSVQYNQSAYRWFGNQDTSGAPVLNFATRTDYATGTSPYAVTSADFNGDGRPDLATANYGSASVSVLLGNGDGTFAAKTDYATGTSPYAVSSADFNGDGRPDLAVADGSSDAVSVFLGTGTGTFQTKVDYATGRFPHSVVIADFNGDGKLDLITANYFADTVSVLLGNGDGTFAAKTDYATGTNPLSVTSADFNGDGKPDLAVTYGTASVSVLLGNGDGTFAAKTDYATGTNPLSVTSADFNGDGRPDLATANSDSSTVSVLLGNGDGTFAAKTDYATGTSPYAVSSADFNGDGKPDLAVADGTASVSVLLGNGDGTFAAKTDYATGNVPRAVTTPDFNGDGKPDLAVANSLNSDTVSILLNTSLPPPIDVSTPLAAQDTAATAPAEGTIFRLRLNLHVSAVQSDANFGQFKLRYAAKTALTCNAEPSANYTDVTTSSTIRYADNPVAQNGQSIVANANDPKHGTDTTIAQSYQEKGATTFTNPNTISIGQDGMWDFALVASHSIQNTHFCFKVVNANGGDLNTYTVYPELIIPTASLTQASYRWFANQDAVSSASVSFAPKTDYATGSIPYSVTTADFNGDGKPDLAVTSIGSDTVSILLGTGTGTFQPKVDYATGGSPISVISADFNGDGKTDLATADSGTYTVSVLLGNGDGTFQPKVDYATGSGPQSVTAADFNADGKLDLAVANAGSDTVSILLGTGDGTFQPKVDYAMGNGPGSITAADFNADGKLDLAATNNNSNIVSVLLGTGTGTFQPEVDYAMGNGPGSITAADFNADGKLDLAAANGGSDTVSILLGTGDGTFQPKVDYATGSSPSSVTTADLNADGKLDLAVANDGSNNVSILLGTGDGTFQPKVDYATGTTPRSVSSADFDGDGRPDLAASNSSDNTVSILLNTSGIAVGAPLANQTTPTDLVGPAIGQPFRLRLAIRVTGSGIAKNSLSFRLQYARMSGNSCASTPSGDYVAVTSSTDVRFYNNPVAPGGFGQAPSPNDPTDGANIIRRQLYTESSLFGNDVSDIYAGEAGLWDFPLVVAATGSHVSYCLRIVSSFGSLLSGYSATPEFSVAPAMHRLMKGGNWFGSTGVKQNISL